MVIVDDEPLALYSVRALIQKQFSEIQIIGEGKDGYEAIELYNKLKPDILIIDIRMPRLSGLDASKQILNDNPDANILILTAFDSFNYVQDALNIGVKGYLLKPINAEEMHDKIESLLGDMNNSNNKLMFNEMVENSINTVKPLIEKEIVNAIISGNSSDQEIKSYANFIQCKIDAGYFMVLGFEEGNVISLNSGIKSNIIKVKIYEVLNNHLGLFKKCIIGNWIGSSVAILFPTAPDANTEMLKKESIVIASEIKKKIKTIVGIDIGVGIGKSFDSSNLKKSFQEANLAFRYAIKKRTIIFSDDIISDKSIKGLPFPIELENKLFEYIRIGNENDSIRTSNEIIATIFRDFNSSNKIKEYFIQLISIIKRIIFQLGCGINELSSVGILDELNILEDAEQIKMWCKINISELINISEQARTAKDNSLVKKAVAYIDSHMISDIKLEIVADEIGISPQYLSRFFKEKMGQNFIDFITEKKINQAKKLLENEELSIKEVALKLGYTEANYFGRIFKKITGLTPKQYREI